MTEAARAIVGCVEACRQRYGTTVILDTLRGANTVKIRNYHMDENPFYGGLAKMPGYKLRQILNQLQLKGYLLVTNDEYALVRLTEKSGELLRGEASLHMKMAREPEKIAPEKSRKTRKAAAGRDFTEQEESLFEKLRSLRREIAKEAGVPPYIVFSDKTLTHMCLVKPKTKEEMLTVTGVGEFKYERYGERFLRCLADA